MRSWVRSFVIVLVVAAATFAGTGPQAHADPAAISGAIQFPAGTFPPDIDPDFPTIAVFDFGEEEIHYEVFADHQDVSGLNADLSWDVDSSQLRWSLVSPPETTYRFTVFWSRWVYTGPIPNQVDSKQFWLTSSSSSMALEKSQATVYAVGTSGLFHCASGFEGCAAGGGGSSPAVTAGTPTITGKPQVGEKLTASPGTWQPGSAQLAYLWLRDGKPIAGATAATYVAAALDAAKKLSVQVTGSMTGYTATSATSAQTAAVARGELTTKKPKISGKAQVGKTLTAKAGKWKPSGVELHYQWFADGQKIAKANKSTYTIPGSLAGAKIVVKVTGTKSGYTTATKASSATTKVQN